MPSEAAPPLITDLSLGLLVGTIVLGVYLKYFSRPLPLVHPLLLGKQSDVSQTRNHGESGVYRSWATGHGSPVSSLSFSSGAQGKTGSRGDGQRRKERELILEQPSRSLAALPPTRQLAQDSSQHLGSLMPYSLHLWNFRESQTPVYKQEEKRTELSRASFPFQISNDLLKLRSKNIAKGLVALLGLDASSATESAKGGVLNLLPDSFGESFQFSETLVRLPSSFLLSRHSPRAFPLRRLLLVELGSCRNMMLCTF